jgi:hypothetical protein
MKRYGTSALDTESSAAALLGKSARQECVQQRRPQTDMFRLDAEARMAEMSFAEKRLFCMFADLIIRTSSDMKVEMGSHVHGGVVQPLGSGI